MLKTPAQILADHAVGILVPVGQRFMLPRRTSVGVVETGSPPSGGHYPSNFIWHGGITVPHPKVVICYWSGSGPYPGASIEGATRDIVEGGFLTAAAIYGGGPGEYSNTTYNLGQSGGAGTIADSTIQAVLTAAIAGGSIPRPDYQTCYVVLTPPGAVVTAFGVASCQYFCGYHGALADGVSFYAVIPDNTCYACHGPNDPLSVYTAIIAHEIGEWATDPNTNAASGWYDNVVGENGDICAWQIVPYNTWMVQPLWDGPSQCFTPVWGGNHAPVRLPRATSFIVDQITPSTAVNTGDTIGFRITATMPAVVEGTVDLGFGGMGDKLHFSSSDAAAIVPADYQMTLADRGRHSFVAAVTFRSPGSQTFTVKSDLHPTIAGTSATFTVTSVNPPVNPPGSAVIPIEAAQKHPVHAQAVFQNVEVAPHVPVTAIAAINVASLSPRHTVDPPAAVQLGAELLITAHSHSTRSN